MSVHSQPKTSSPEPNPASRSAEATRPQVAAKPDAAAPAGAAKPAGEATRAGAAVPVGVARSAATADAIKSDAADVHSRFQRLDARANFGTGRVQSQDQALDQVVRIKSEQRREADGGIETISTDRRILGSEAEAQAAFKQTTAQLLDVNNWKGLGPGALATDFRLHDRYGQPVNRPAAIGDFVKINLPGPDGGPDWVRIEAVTLDPNRTTVMVRPTYDPTRRPPRTNETAHFFTKETTNTFILERNGQELKSTVHGQNEVPNTGREAGGFLKSLRNGTVARAGWEGPQRNQWEAFNRKLLDT